MPIELRWLDNQKGALVYRFPEQWTWEDFYAVKLKADGWLNECRHDVVLLLDMTASQSIPPGAITQGRYLISRAHPRGKPVILISQNPMIEILVSMAGRFEPNISQLVRTAPTLEKARSHITQTGS